MELNSRRVEFNYMALVGIVIMVIFLWHKKLTLNIMKIRTNHNWKLNRISTELWSGMLSVFN